MMPAIAQKLSSSWKVKRLAWSTGAAGPQVFVERFDPGVAIKRIASLSERDRERLIRDAYADLRGRQPS